jgi:FG-GAP-like repeat
MSWRKTSVLSKLPHFAAIALAVLQLSAVAEAQVLPGGDAAGRPRVSVRPDRIAASIQAEESTLSTQNSASFIAHRDFVAADVAGRSAQADLNGDGITDLVVTNGNLNGTNISVLLGNSDGTFQPAAFFNTGGFAPFAVVLGDFNGDGKKDAAVTTLNGVSVLLGDGKGSFGAPATFSAGSGPAEIVAADFSGDGKLDLAVANSGSNDVSILVGDSRGSFTAGATLAVGRAPVGIAAGDFNHDGREDLAVADSGLGSQGSHPNTVAILLGTDGGFKPATFISVAAGPLGVAGADFNKDSKLDVAVTNSSTDQVSVMLGNGNGTFQPPAVFTVTPGSVPEPGTAFGAAQVTVDDFNGDGNKDLAIANSLTSTAAVLLGDGKGKFGKALNLQVGKTPVAVSRETIIGTANAISSPPIWMPIPSP